MKKKLSLIVILAIGVSGCASTGSSSKSDDVLFASIADQRAVDGVQPAARKMDDPTCIRFYANAAKYAATPNIEESKNGFLTTMAAGLIAGVVTGGVASAGISSTFVETALMGSASQIAFGGSEKVIDQTINKEPSMQDKIDAAASELGCPPAQSAATKGATELSKL